VRHGKARNFRKTQEDGRLPNHAVAWWVIDVTIRFSGEWHCHAFKELSRSELRISQFCAEDFSWFLHQFVAVTPSFEHAWFQPAGPIGDLAFGNLR